MRPLGPRAGVSGFLGFFEGLKGFMGFRGFFEGFLRVLDG